MSQVVRCWLAVCCLLAVAGPGCDNSERAHEQILAADTARVVDVDDTEEIEELHTGVEFALDSIAMGDARGSYLYRVPTSRTSEMLPMGDSVLLGYQVKIGTEQVWLEHFYSPEVLDSGRMYVDLCRYSRLWYGGRLVRSHAASDLNILDLDKCKNEALVLDRGSSRIVVVYGGYLWCHGHYCSTISVIAILETPSESRSYQFDTGIWSEDRIWDLIREDRADTTLRLPVIDSEYSPEKKPERWVNIDSVFAAMN